MRGISENVTGSVKPSIGCLGTDRVYMTFRTNGVNIVIFTLLELLTWRYLGWAIPEESCEYGELVNFQVNKKATQNELHSR